MAKVRLAITKGDEIRYLSHLDYARTIERALRRSKLPVAYSEGFNPHMKVAYASALSVGVAADTEYMDIELKTDIGLDDIKSALARQLPAGIRLNQIKYVADRAPALMAIVNLAIYHITVPLADGADEQQFLEAFERFLAAPHVTYVKQSPKGRREIAVKELLAAAPAATVTDDMAEITMSIHNPGTGSIKAAEVLTVMVQDFGLPARFDSASITRRGLFVDDGGYRLTPMEVI